MELSELLHILTLERIELNLFRARHPLERTQRLYGGQIMAQAYIAAAATVDDDRTVNSLHGYFLRPGDPRTPALIKVEHSREGRAFSNRRVVVQQHGKAIFTMDLGFQVSEPGPAHQAPMPENLSPPAEEKIPAYLLEDPIISWRHDFRRLQSTSPQPPQQFVWFRSNGPVPEDPQLHTALLIYESDRALLSTARLPHRGKVEREHIQVASLDHAMWFYAPVDINAWTLYALDSPSTSGARGLTRGLIYRQDGTLAATTMQEGLQRIHLPGGED